MEFKEKIGVIGDIDTVTGFRLAGVSKTVVADTYTCEEKMLVLLADPRTGILLVQEDLMDKLTHRTRKLLDSISRPAVVAIPGKSMALAHKKSGSIKEMVKRAIGVELKV